MRKSDESSGFHSNPPIKRQNSPVKNVNKKSAEMPLANNKPRAPRIGDNVADSAMLMTTAVLEPATAKRTSLQA
ncbi:MAG: hypothetical protein WAJ85_00120 [Candidatus Baltobacteraceae bacterium]